MGGAETLIEIARILTTEPDLAEALRQVARQVARFIGAETAAVYLLDQPGRLLFPVAGYRVPSEMRPVLAAAAVPVDEQGFRDSVFSSAAVTWSDDVPHDPRFAFELFRRFPHRSGVIVPLHVDRRVAGVFYLVWWQRAERPDEALIATLEAVGQQVALLLSTATLLRETERQRTEAQTAEQRYHGLVEHLPVGIYRTTPSGKMLDVNAAMVQILRFPDRESLLGINAASLYVNPEDRWRGNRMRDADGVTRDFRAELRAGDGGVVWARMNARVVRDGGEEYWEGVIEDMTDQRRVDEAERRAETLRVVAELANAAAHEINNPLAVITGRLELLRRHVDPAQHSRLDQALEAARRITDIIAHMGRITRVESHGDSKVSPMLDLRRSSELPEQP